jgi:hypothetical protein
MSKYSTNFGNSDLTQRSSTLDGGLTAVRVYDVILDATHKDYPLMGKELSIGLIRYAPIDRIVEKKDINTLPYAFPLHTNIKVLPLINEVVVISNLPSEKSLDTYKANVKVYYTAIVGMWNNPNCNFLVDEDDQDIVEKEFAENIKVKPLFPYPGDVLIEGRYGHSIRLGGTKTTNNTLSTSENNSLPFTLITNGQTETTEEVRHTVENINEDSTSIYLLSDHTVPLEQARDKTKAWKKAPTKADSYQGSQVMVNGGRLYFNSKEESTLFSSKEAFGVTSKTINLDAEDYIALDAKKIYLGERALREEFEPVILGESMEGFLYTLLFNLQALADDLIIAGTAGVNVQNLITRGKLMQASLKGLQNQINPGGKSQLKSRKVYTE